MERSGSQVPEERSVADPPSKGALPSAGRYTHRVIQVDCVQLEYLTIQIVRSTSRPRRAVLPDLAPVLHWALEVHGGARRD